ncbi:hypothetical protein M434DRAFT_395446 [Hypoxylon sp. CO27-5]|nr:hypothetical protein M434DRAFT_395446 [Hypoxylon sp. CO27-5]
MPIIKPGTSQHLQRVQAPHRVGLSRNQKTDSLLKRVRGQDNPLHESGSVNVKNQTPGSKMRQSAKVREPESIDAPPQSSDGEEDYRHPQDSDDDQDENGRGDIKPTTFKSVQSAPSQRNDTRRSTRDRSRSSYQNEEPSSSAGSKRSAEESLPETGGHLMNAYGFSKQAKKTKSAATYGGKSSQPRSSQLKSSRKSTPRSSAKSPPAKSFKHPRTSWSPESVRSPPARRFIKPESLSPEKTRPSKAFKPPPSADLSPSRDRPALRRRSLPSDTSPPKSKLKLFDVDEELEPSIEKRASRKPTKTERAKRSKANTQRGSPKPVSEESSQRPIFKLHALDDLDYLDDSDDKVIATFENVSDDEIGDVTIESTAAATARCPMCQEVVDAELLAKHSDHGRMNIRKQAAFCRLHNRQTALSDRSEKGYPKIDWRTLDTRLEKHQDMLKDILEGTRESYYREVLKENVESGKNRTLLKTQDSLTPGYYGPRGLRAMTEYIMRTLSSVVRKRAVEDRLVSARGYTGYVQVVLVPELAVRLIMEDMSVAEEDARKIMEDSIEFGELLHEDVGDVIAGVSDEEAI